MNRSKHVILAVIAALTLGACGGPPQAPPGVTLGYGTPGVSGYMPAPEADSLQAELDHCRAVPQAAAAPRPQTLEAACDQLHRTLRNQPGNAVSAAR